MSLLFLNNLAPSSQTTGAPVTSPDDSRDGLGPRRTGSNFNGSGLDAQPVGPLWICDKNQ
jgi:hypothetical protein